MPSDDYAAVAGGALRLKGSGSKVQKGGKKKKTTKGREIARPATLLTHAGPSDSPDGSSEINGPATDTSRSKQALNQDGEGGGGKEPEAAPVGASTRSTKTPAEIRHEERRRQRLAERIEREGVKTHKERVEELNRYLSRLSEHHDMPRIGPG